MKNDLLNAYDGAISTFEDLLREKSPSEKTLAIVEELSRELREYQRLLGLTPFYIQGGTVADCDDYLSRLRIQLGEATKK